MPMFLDTPSNVIYAAGYGDTAYHGIRPWLLNMIYDPLSDWLYLGGNMGDLFLNIINAQN